MKKFLEVVQAEMEIKTAPSRRGLERLICKRCSASNPLDIDKCLECGAPLGINKNKEIAIPVVAPPTPSAETPLRFNLSRQNIRQGLIYKILLGPPRGLQDDFD